MKSNPRFFYLIIPLLSVFLVASRCSSKPTEPAAQVADAGDTLPVTDSTITILYQSGRNGSLEPCGCHSTPYGGIDRELNAVRKLKAANPRVLYVDPGNMLSPLVKPDLREPMRKKAHVIVDAMALTGLSVFAPGPYDVSLGIPLLKELQKKAKFEFVSANLADKAGKLIFDPSTVVQVGPWKVGVTGISPTYKFPEGKILDPIKALQKELASLSTKSDWIVVLSQMGTHDDNLKLLGKFPEVRMIFGTDGKRVLANGDMIAKGQQLAFNQRPEGFYLGRVDVEFKKPFKGFFSKKWAALSNDAIKGWEEALGKVPEEKKKELEKNIADYKTNRLLAPIEGGSEFAHTMIPLDEATYGTKNELSDAVAKYKESLRQEAVGKPAKK
jgi:2',3'-cyclic-nucleotide 2'-phosphodiesterase (5'-nucleotidase family)